MQQMVNPTQIGQDLIQIPTTDQTNYLSGPRKDAEDNLMVMSMFIMTV